VQPKDKVPTLTIKELQIVKAKVEATLEGRSQRSIAKELYPNASPRAAEVEISYNLRKPAVKTVLQAALEKHGISADRIMGVVSDGMKATKVNIVRDPSGGEESAFAEETADHGIRLKAAGMAANFMGLGKDAKDAPSVHFHQHIETKKTDYEF
jgi:hypothetical protein